MKDRSRQLFTLLFVLALIVNLSGINLNFFTDDPALYASLAKNLVWKKDIWQLYNYNTDWLDKPHFPFWLSWLSFKIFGIGVWAYRLPALLCFLLSLFYTYIFSRKYYNAETAMAAVLILMTAQNVVMLNTDVRAEPYLMAFVVAAVYHIACLHERFSVGNLVLCALFTAFAIMTKGLFVIVAIYGALGGQLLLKDKFRGLFSFKWVLLLILTAIFILPEVYAVYKQFDLHPEKMVFNTHHVSGVKWFLWDSQFGRFINNGPIQRKSSSVIFYVHTLLWAFAPWCLLFYFAVYKNIQALVKKIQQPEYYAISGGILLFLLFSVSRFQLPFYTNTVFPLFAIVTAPYCFRQLSNSENIARRISLWPFIILLPVVVLLVNYFLGAGKTLLLITEFLLFIVLVTLTLLWENSAAKKAFMLACAGSLFVNIYLTTIFYKVLIGYKGEIAAAQFVNEPQNDHLHLYSLRNENNSFQFYSNRPVDLVQRDNFKDFHPTDSCAFYANHDTYNYLKQNNADFRVLKAFVNYPQENILPAFINKSTRSRVLDSVYIIDKK